LSNDDSPFVDDGVGTATMLFHPASRFIARALIIGDGNRSASRATHGAEIAFACGHA